MKGHYETSKSGRLVEARALEYTFDDRLHVMSAAEVEAIEQTGRSNVQDYFACSDEVEPPPFIMEKVIAMHSRPDKVSVGARPSEFDRQGGQRTAWSDAIKGLIHWNRHTGGVNGTGCGSAYSAEGFAGTRFRYARNHPRACEACVMAFDKIHGHMLAEVEQLK